MTIYTQGVWVAKAGEADAFVDGWSALAVPTKEMFPTATAMLLRDCDDPNRFVSVGPWDSMEDIAAWRGSAFFGECIGNIRAQLEGFEPSTLDVVVDLRDDA